MQKDSIVILPNQLYEDNPFLPKERVISLVEHEKFFTDYKFHKQKLVFHRASMKAYEQKLKDQGYKVEYVEFNQPFNGKINENFNELGFLTPINQIESFFAGAKKLSFTPFYIDQRKRLKILVNKQNKPDGGKWSFDPENRRRIPNGTPIPQLRPFGQNEYVKEAQTYVERHFPDNPGSVDGFIYPVMHEGCKQWLKDFIEQRLRLFGDYEDAIDKDESYLFHSVLSFALNSGLITPQEVLSRF